MMRTFRLAILACASSLAMSATVQPLHAQSTEQTEEAADGTTLLEKLTVKSGVKGVADTPLATETSAEDLDAAQVETFEDLGRTLQPGVGFNRTNGSVNIRGLEGPRVQTTIDGVPIPYLDDGARDADGGIDSFDFDTLSAVDVVRGADSSRAGDGALGGTVVLRTLEPDDIIGEGRDWGGIFKFTFNGDDTSVGGSLALAKRFGNTSVLVQGGYKKGEERRTTGDEDLFSQGRTEANPAQFDQRNVLVKIKQETESGHAFTLTGERFDRDETTDLRSEQSPPYGNYRPGFWDGIEATTRDRLSMNYTFEAVDDDALFDAANAVFYWQHLTHQVGKSGRRFVSVVGPYTRMSDVDNRSFGGSGYVERSFDGGPLTHKVRLSGDFSVGTTTQYSSGEDSCDEVPNPASCDFLHTNQADSPDVDSKKFGLYLEDEIALHDSAFSLTPGLRYDWYDQSPQETAAYTRNPNYDGLPAGQSGDAFSPKLLAKVQATPDVELFAQWAMAFRSPTATELYLDYGGPGTYLRLGNPDLKPETSNGFELGAKLGDEDFGGRITGFYNRYRNFIDTDLAAVQDPVNYPLGVTQYLNRDRVRIYGVEASLTKRFDSGFHVGGSVTYTNGVDLETDLKLGTVAPLKGVLTAGYAADTWGADVSFIGVKAVSDNTNATFKPPGYGLVDLTGWWKPEKVDGLTVRAGLYNVFDKEYYDALNVRTVDLSAVLPARQFYSEPGRSLKITLTQRF